MVVRVAAASTNIEFKGRLMKDIVILEGARTPMTEWIGGRAGNGQKGGALSQISAVELGAIATREALKRSALSAEAVDHLVLGNAIQTGVNPIYAARHVALDSGCSIETPAVTVNRLCGSGIQALISGAQMIALDEASVVAATGTENLSQAPFVIRGAREGLRLGGGTMDDMLLAALTDERCGCPMAKTSDNLARKYEISREDQDAYAARSHRAGARATADGTLSQEITPVEIQGRKGSTTVIEADDHFVADTSVEKLAGLRPPFGEDSMVTAGNASGIVDGAASLILASGEVADGQDRKPLGRIMAWDVTAVEPEIMGIGPAPAIRGALQRAGIALDEIDLFEINEAFAGQYLAVEKELELDRDRVNVNGGAIALGHPLGATGTRLVLTLLYELRRSGRRTGVASACIGGGQGIAIVVATE